VRFDRRKRLREALIEAEGPDQGRTLWSCHINASIPERAPQRGDALLD
jgi:hypothetical protein